MPYIGQEAATTYSTRLAVQQFNGDGSTTAFTLNQSVSADQDILVSVDGVIQDNSAYTVSNGTTLTFSPAPSSGTANIFVNYLGLAVGTVTHPATQGLTATTGTFTSDISTPTLGTSNFRAGVNAGNSIASGGNNNTVVGDEAGTAITTGDQNTIMGHTAGDALTVGGKNTVFGQQALSSDTQGSKSVAMGEAALYAQNFTSATDAYNVAVGNDAGAAITTGKQNTLIGGLAGDAITTADNNTAVGFVSLSANTTGHSNVAVGKDALAANTEGDKNNALGMSALDANTTGNENNAFGFGALGANTTGSENVAVGQDCLVANTTASNNTAVGTGSLKTNTTGTNNTAFGKFALRQNVAGDNTVAIGNEAAMLLNPSGNVDMNGVYIGYQAGDEVTTGRHNTVIGALTANAMTTGTNNLLLGTTAGNSSQPGGEITTGSSQIVLGNASSTNAHIQIDWTVVSDERDKTDFTALDLGLDFVKELEPVTYKWDKRAKYGDDISTVTHDGTHKEDWLDVGFKAQAVEALEEAAGYKIADKTNLTTNLTDDGKQYGLTYSKFVPILVKAIQELSEKIAALEAK